MTKITAAITGVGGYVPEYVLTNQELEKMVETSDEWITSRTGIKERRILKGEGMGTSHMCEHAVRDLLKKTNTDPLDVDLVIVATVTPDFIFPSTANMVCDMVGMKNAWSYDLQAACSGFLFALSNAVAYVESGKHKKVVVIGADKMSSIVDYTDRTTCIIFGDGAGAVLVEPNTEGNGVIDQELKTDGAGYPHLNAKAGGSRYPITHEILDKGEQYAYQDGPTVFKFAVTKMADVSAEVVERNNLNGENIAYLVAHQANKRIIDATANRIGIDPDKVLINIERYGNTTAATIPLVFMDFEHKFKKGDNIMLAAFGGGFTWGAMYLKWAYDAK